MKKCLTIAFMIIYTISYSFNSVNKDTIAKVIRVIDGNTIEIFTEDGEVLQVLFKDVDSPELGQEFGNKAKEFTENLLLNKKVIVEMKGKDMWGNRLVGVTLKNGKSAEVELLAAGLAWHNKIKSESIEFSEIEIKSKKNKLGLWVNDNPVEPWVFRRQQTMTVAKSR
ncbi:MAG: thermonuclease family protein [Cyclobacteriaceae bacterium]|nr:thermonuclease family protein [Cyclobacteriaceae bacterium]